MCLRRKISSIFGQAAVEYMLLLAVIVSIVILAIPTFFPKAQEGTELFFNRAAVGIMGSPPPP